MAKKLKGRKKLNKRMTKALSAFGVTAKVGESFAYYWEKHLVTFPVVDTQSEGEQFLIEFVKDRFDMAKVDPFTLFLLHEIGHHKANDEMEGAVGQFCWDEKERIENELFDLAEDDIEGKKRLHYQYYNLPEEIMATQWAVNYIKKHPKAVHNLIAKCGKAIYDFYEKNEVEG